MGNRIKKAVIPAAGFGTRFLPITKVVPKELLPVGSKPAIQYVVEEAVASGIEEIILVCHPSKSTVIDYFKPDRDLNDFLEKRGKRKEIDELKKIESLARFTVVTQKEPRGLGDAVLCARDAVAGEPFLVMLPDVLIADEIPETRRLIEDGPGGEWGILLERVSRERVSSYGIIRGEEGERGVWTIRGAVEKPRPEEAPSDLAILGRYLFTPEIFGKIEKSGKGKLGEVQLTDAIDALAKTTTGKGIVCRGRIFDVGTPQGLIQAYQHFARS